VDEGEVGGPSGEGRDVTRRFSDRARDYARHRPDYPGELFGEIARVTGLSAGWTVADVGSGTGISTGPFLRLGCEVLAVEPNDAMRHVAEAEYAAERRFRSTSGTAEDTGLADASVDLVAAGQAFHWFRFDETAREFRRILRGPGFAALFWNRRLARDSPFQRAYEALIRRHAIDYDRVNHRRITAADFRRFFRLGHQRFSFANGQTLDRDALEGRLLSSSYMPGADHPGRAALSADVDRLFRAHQVDGAVEIAYETALYLGRLLPG